MVSVLASTVDFQWADDEVCFDLDQHVELDFYSTSSLKQQFADRRVATLGHIILIQSQPVFARYPQYCVFSGEALQSWKFKFIIFP
jgi:hypothetical protein